MEIDLDVRNLWTNTARIASSDCKVGQTVRLRFFRDVVGREIVTNIRDDMQKFVNDRGKQLCKLRLKRYEEDKKRRLALNPSEAFQCLKPEIDPHLSALHRQSGSITGSVVEMEEILRKKMKNHLLQTQR